MNDKILDLVVRMIESNKADSEKRLESIDEKLDELLAFKWRLAGVTGVLSLIGGVVVQLIIAKAGS